MRGLGEWEEGSGKEYLFYKESNFFFFFFWGGGGGGGAYFSIN